MKKTLLTFILNTVALGIGYAQFADGMVLQPTHVVGKQINAVGEVTGTLESDFSYNEDGKVVTFDFPQYGLSSAFIYEGDYLRQEGVSHAGGDPNYGSNPEILEFLVYTYNEDGKIKHLKHEWSEMNSTKDWDYSYDEFGRLKQKDYKDGETVYHQHYIYDYEDEDRTVIESFWTSWELEGLKLKKRTIYHYDADFSLNTVHTEVYNLDGEITGATMVTYVYTLSGKEESQIEQTLIEDEWVNNSIQRYIYDNQDRVIERQNGTWSTENNDWVFDRKITFTFEPLENGFINTVSFFKKNGEDWVWDVFANQNILFGSQLKTQQNTLRHFVFEEMNGASNINQFEFTLSYTTEPIYLELENQEYVFSTLYPNPTDGFITIAGQGLKSAEVFNTLGQQVATATGEGERLNVDLNGLPAGVYFVTITDKDGRKCVRKVVKE